MAGRTAAHRLCCAAPQGPGERGPTATVLGVAGVPAKIDDCLAMLRLAPFVFALPVVAQATWTNVAPPSGPSARTEVQMHSDGSGVWLFGGLNGPSQTAFDELWRFDGISWTLQTPVGASPPPRSRFAATWDLIRQRFVVFGGDAQYAGGGARGDTWEFDPSTATWTQLFRATSPSPRIHARMATDLITGRVLMFGGSGAGAAETWSWDGTDWTLLSPATVPPARQQQGMTTDLFNGRIVMFGGSTGAASGVLGDTWTWNGSDWSQVVTPTTPGGTGVRNGKMTFDTVRGRHVYFGGVRGVGGFSNSAWEFDGADWRERLLSPAPAGRAGLGFSFVDALGTNVLFGGYNGGFFSDTWTYQTNALATKTTFGTGCASPSGVPNLNVLPLPWLEETLTWSFSSLPPSALPLLVIGLSDTVAEGLPLPLSLAALGAPQCQLLVSTETITFAPAGLSLTLPNDPLLIGESLYSQGIVLSAATSPFGVSATNATALQIGAR